MVRSGRWPWPSSWARWRALYYLHEADPLVVPSLGRLGRSIQDLIALVSACASAVLAAHPVVSGACGHGCARIGHPTLRPQTQEHDRYTTDEHHNRPQRN